MRRGLKGTIWGIIILLLVFGMNPLNAQYRVMLIGDEITSGTEGSDPVGGYRDDLAGLYDAEAMDVNFVGSLSTGTGFDNDHEGHDYFTADLIDANLNTWISQLGSQFPRFFMLHIGTADISQNQTNETTIQEIENIVDKMYAHDIANYIFVSSLIPRKDQKDGTTTQLNTLIQILVAEKKAAGYDIYYVGHNEAFKANPYWATEYMSDDIHPNNAGYQVMAQVYFSVFIAAILDLDFGDLPDVYNLTTLSDDGARHEVGSVYLGTSIDSETDGQESADAGRSAADGDDGLPVGATDDEDGITVSGSWNQGANGGAIDVTVTGGAGYLSGWINWDDDNAIEAGEQILDMRLVVSGTQTVQFNIPAGAIPGYNTYDRFARFRLTTSNTTPLTLTGLAGIGEVEDYYLRFNSGEAEMDIKGNGQSIVDGDETPSTFDDTDFGPVNITTGSVEHVFEIRNSGVVNLDLIGSPKVLISGTNAGDFVVIEEPASSVPVNGATTFKIRFNPSAIALRTAMVSIENNDFNENPYNFFIQGTGSNNQYFPVAQTGDAHPIVISNATIDGVQIQTGVEIGVFDGTLCVGAFQYSAGDFSLMISAWKEVELPNGTVLPGAKCGNSMIFKLWDSVESTEYNATPTFSTGEGSYCESLTACTLAGNKLEHFTNVVGATGSSHAVIVNNATINDNEQLTAGDEIAVYDGSLCVGVSKYSGSYPLTITCWMQVTLPDQTVLPGATANNSMSFKVWDKNMNDELIAIPTYGTSSNGLFGEQPFTEVLLLEATVVHTIPISHSMLNTISFNVKPQNFGIDLMLNDIETLLIAKDDNGNFYIPSYNVNDIGDVDFAKGYKIYMTATSDDNVVNEGLPLEPQNYSHSFSNTKLYTIGYPYQTAHLVEGVFASISTKVVLVKDHDGKFWIPQYNVNTIGYMQPGKGYDIFVNQVTDYTYPNLTVNLAKTNYPIEEIPATTHFQFEKTGLPYGVVITNSEEKLSVFDEIGVFAENLCVGAAVFTGEFPLLIPAWEGDLEHSLKGFENGQEISFRVWKAKTGKKLDIGATFTNSKESVFGGSPLSVAKLNTAGDQLSITPNSFVLEQNYPNPFNPETTISFQLAKNSKINLTIYNMEGKLIKRLESGLRDAGSYEIKWNGLDERGQQVTSGVYFYRLDTGEFSDMKKMILIK